MNAWDPNNKVYQTIVNFTVGSYRGLQRAHNRGRSHLQARRRINRFFTRGHFSGGQWRDSQDLCHESLH